MELALESRCVRIKLKPNSIESVRAWAAEVNSRKAEALEIIRGESVSLECAYLDESAGELIYFMRAESLSRPPKAAGELLAGSLGAYHHQFKKECWQSITPLEELIDLDAMCGK